MILDKGRNIGVWISEDGARLFLGRTDLTAGHRWLVVGQVEEEQQGIGVWINVEEIIELEPASPRAEDIAPPYQGKWTVTPALCLIRWQWIISVQAPPGKSKEFGIRPASS